MTGAREPFNWAAAMAFGLGVLKLPARDFWSMTPRELDAALTGHYGRRRAQGAPDRAGLQALMQQYPDQQPTEQMRHDP